MSQASQRKAARFLSHLEPIQPALAAYCRCALTNRDDVADALQSAVANAYRDFDLYAEGTNFRAWMFRYVSYEILNRNRAAARHRTVDLPREIPAERVTSGLDESVMSKLLDDPEIVLDDCEDVVSQAVHRLPDLERSIFLLRAIAEFKYREIAEILEVPIGTVMGLLSRGRDRLREELAEYGKKRGLLPRSDNE